MMPNPISLLPLAVLLVSTGASAMEANGWWGNGFGSVEVNGANNPMVEAWGIKTEGSVACAVRHFWFGETEAISLFVGSYRSGRLSFPWDKVLQGDGYRPKLNTNPDLPDLYQTRPHDFYVGTSSIVAQVHRTEPAHEKHVTYARLPQPSPQLQEHLNRTCEPYLYGKFAAIIKSALEKKP